MSGELGRRGNEEAKTSADHKGKDLNPGEPTPFPCCQPWKTELETFFPSLPGTKHYQRFAVVDRVTGIYFGLASVPLTPLHTSGVLRTLQSNASLNALDKPSRIKCRTRPILSQVDRVDKARSSYNICGSSEKHRGFSLHRWTHMPKFKKNVLPTPSEIIV